jgi:hypothetical protein
MTMGTLNRTITQTSATRNNMELDGLVMISSHLEVQFHLRWVPLPFFKAATFKTLSERARELQQREHQRPPLMLRKH